MYAVVNWYITSRVQVEISVSKIATKDSFTFTELENRQKLWIKLLPEITLHENLIRRGLRTSNFKILVKDNVAAYHSISQPEHLEKVLK